MLLVVKVASEGTPRLFSVPDEKFTWKVPIIKTHFMKMKIRTYILYCYLFLCTVKVSFPGGRGGGIFIMMLVEMITVYQLLYCVSRDHTTSFTQF